MKKHIKYNNYGEIMRFLLLVLVGFSSGIFAGMGMGGGTFLVPLLSLCFGVEQIFCQSTNVLCFLILSIVCFVIYTVKKMIDFKVMIFVGVPASVVAGVVCLFSLKIHSNILRMIFAGFIILIGVIMLVLNLVQNNKKNIKN